MMVQVCHLAKAQEHQLRYVEQNSRSRQTSSTSERTAAEAIYRLFALCWPNICALVMRKNHCTYRCGN
jgi:hypothetical protein